MQYEVIKGINFGNNEPYQIWVDCGYIGGLFGNILAGYFVLYSLALGKNWETKKNRDWYNNHFN